ncbi:MAG: hypothetical protein ACHBN1_15880 [Heteroscytonema crispum UTEX LB 1556]
MNSKTKLLTLLTGTLAVSSLTVGTVFAQANLTNQSKVTVNGIGPVRIGMTVPEATKAAGTKLVSLSGTPISNAGCFYVKPQGAPRGVEMMLQDGRIARVDIMKNSRITTVKGAKIGDTEAQIKSLYPGQIQVTPHKYTQGGHYLTLIPKDRADQNYRIVFETDGKRVTQFRSGKLPEVENVERCG